MLLAGLSARTARILAIVSLCTSVGLAAALAGTWIFVSRLALRPIPGPELPAKMRASTEPVSPLQIHYQLDLPGRGEIFPALVGNQPSPSSPSTLPTIPTT